MKVSSCATQPTPTNTENFRWGRKVLILLIILGSLFWGWLKIRNPETFPVRTVKIIGAVVHVNHQALRNTITPYIAHGMLWLNAFELENSLNQLPWIEKATLIRKWPDEIFIRITEQTPVAYWNNTALLNNKGEIFTPDQSVALPQLPALYGPNNAQSTVWEGVVTMNHLLQPLGLSIVTASMTDRQVWEIYLNNGVHLFLGRENVLPRLKQFIAVYPKIAANAKEIAYVDLRYSDGFAIKWKNNPATG